MRKGSLLLGLILGSTAVAQSPSARVDALFQRWHTPESPGAAVLITQNGEVVHARGYGMANLAYGVPIGPRTVFDIASVSKQFGAMAILLLEAEGRLRLDDDVRTHIPELPDFGHTITLRHLVHHTSGLRDWPGTLRMAGWSFDDVISFDQILRMARHQRELNFAPGSAYAYSNTGYNLLAEVVQRVTGRSFRDWTDERIFRPLGMRDTHFHDDHAMIVPNLAESYRPAGDGTWRRATDNLTALASSSLFTTIEDLALWVANFDHPIVGGPAVVARSHERGVLTTGDTIAYAFGQGIGSYRGLRTVSHTGSWAGYRSVLLRFPGERFGVIILANAADMNPSALGHRIADIYLADRLEPVPALSPASPPPTSLRPWQPTAADLAHYPGRYASGELDTAWDVEVVEGQLVARHFRTGAVRLTALEPDRFRATVFGELVFLRDGTGTVVAFTANSDRIRQLRFDRVR